MKKAVTEQRGALSPVRLPVASLFILMSCIFVLVPDGLFRFTLPKLAFLAAGVGLGIIAGSRTRLAPQVAWTASGVLAVFALAAVVVDGFGPSFWGRWPRYEGVPTVAAYLLLLLVGSRLLGPGANATVRTFWTRMVAGSMLLLALAAVLEALGVNLLGDSDNFRFGATLGNATDMGIAGLTGCAVLLPRAIFRRAPWDIAGAIGGAIVAAASGSRAVIIVLAVLIVAVIAWRAWQNRGASGLRRGGLWLFGGVASVALAVLAFPDVRERLLTGGTVTGRVDLWTATWALVQDNWLLGVGPGRYVDALPPYQTEGFAARVGTDFPADSPHMIPLQWLADGGVPLLVANLLLCAAVLWAAARNIRTSCSDADRLFLVGAAAAVGSFALVLLTHFPTPGTTVIAGLCAGALAGVVPSNPKPDKPAARKAAPAQFQQRNASKVPVIAGPAAVSCLAVISVAAGMASAAEVSLKRGEAAIREGRLGEASEHFESAAALRRWDPDVALLAGQAFAGRAAAGDPASGKLAAQWSARSLKANPGSVESMTSLAVGHLAAGDLAAAQETLAEARLAAPVNSQVWLQSGLAEYAAGRADSAVAYVAKAASLTPDPEEERAILAALQEAASAP